MLVTKDNVPKVSMAELERMAEAGKLDAPMRVCVPGYVGNVHLREPMELLGRTVFYLGRRRGMREMRCSLTTDCQRITDDPQEKSLVLAFGEVRVTQSRKLSMDVDSFEITRLGRLKRG